MLLVMRGVPTVVNYATVLRGALGIKSQLPMRGGGGGPPPAYSSWPGVEARGPSRPLSPARSHYKLDLKIQLHISQRFSTLSLKKIFIYLKGITV